MKYDVIVIGAGASGITAAITCKDMGTNVAILEGTDRIAKKILVTGNGRCNITNKNIQLSRYHSTTNHFFKNVLTSFTYKNTINFFDMIGLPLVTLNNNKMYPMSLQASSVIDLLRLSISEKNIPIFFNSKVNKISKKNNTFKLTTNSDEVFYCSKLILATGGKSYSHTGSNGSGFKLASSMGHKVINPLPGLVQLKSDYKFLKALSGIKFDGIAKIFVNDKYVKEDFGEVLFTDYGVSGPPILQLSRTASYNLNKNNSVKIKLDFIPQLNNDELIDLLENHWGMFNYRSVHDSFIGIINKKLIPVLLKEAGVKNIHKCCFDLDWSEKNNIFKLLKDWEFNIVGTKDFNNAQITIGGIDTTEIIPSSLESKLIPNLYFCGEVIDVDGDCGGFKLQWAWSSGFICAKNACKK